MRLQTDTPVGAVVYQSDDSQLQVTSRIGTRHVPWDRIVGAGPFGIHIPMIHVPLPENAPGMLGFAAKAEHMLEANQAYWIAYKPRRSVKLMTISLPRDSDAASQLVSEIKARAGANWRPEPALQMQELRREFGVRRHWWALPLALLIVVVVLVLGLVALVAASAGLALLHDVRVALVVLFLAALWFVIKQFRTKPEHF